MLGDFGIGFFDGRYWTEEMFYDYIAEQEYRVLFCDGNHENFDKLNGYEVSLWNGGRGHIIRKNLIHLMRGEVYKIDEKDFFVMGGGYSIDKAIRVPGQSWWAAEMPTKEEYDNASENLRKCGYKVDYILMWRLPTTCLNERGSTKRRLLIFLVWAILTWNRSAMPSGLRQAR